MPVWGKNPESPPDLNKPVVPAWAPEPVVGTPPPGTPPPPAPSDPYAVDATMRLIPVPHIEPPAPPPAVPPPTSAPIAQPPAPAQPAARHIGKYIVKRELGRGGMGTVYLAEQPGLGGEVAIKELILSAGADPIALKRFIQEAQGIARQ